MDAMGLLGGTVSPCQELNYMHVMEPSHYFVFDSISYYVYLIIGFETCTHMHFWSRESDERF